MSCQYPPPLTCRDIKKILTYLGFTCRSTKATSHEQWIKKENKILHKVTVDCHKEPFSQILIKSMAEQAGLKKKNFYQIFKSI